MIFIKDSRYPLAYYSMVLIFSLESTKTDNFNKNEKSIENFTPSYVSLHAKFSLIYSSVLNMMESFLYVITVESDRERDCYGRPEKVTTLEIIG